ncbi:MAG: redoxin domain-containing protein, partial [Planctomycetota bacterium]
MQQSTLSKLVWSVLLIIISCTTATMAAKPQRGETAPDFEGKTVDGKTVRLSDFKGKVVLLDFWATWCGPCRAETPNVIKAYEQFHKLGFEVIGINMDKDKERMQAYMKEKNLQGQHTFSGKGWEDPIAREYGVSGIPTMMVLDKDQKVYSPNARGHRLQQALAELFGVTDSIEKKAVELESLKAAGDTAAFEQAAEGFSELLIEEPHFLNEMAWDWANNQKTNYQAAVIAARKAVELRPKALHMLDTLAYAESGAGYYDESVEHFTQCVDQGMTESSTRLATALALRNQPGDLEKAYEIVQQGVLAGSVDRYLHEALDALRQSPFDTEAIETLNDQLGQHQAMIDLLNSDNLLDPEQAKDFRQDASRFNGHDYKVFRVPLGWEKARIRCREMGGYLACITSPEENEFIVNLAKETPYPPSTCCWIGGKENDWGAFARWVSGEPLKMSDHVVNENPRELYLNLRLHSGNWEDYPDTGERSGGQWFVCEWPSDDPSQDHPEFADGTLAQCPDKRELKAHIDRARKRVKGSGKGHVIVGQVVLDGEGDVREVNAQMEILSGGYFAGPVKDLNRPVGFRMHQYAPYDLKL